MKEEFSAGGVVYRKKNKSFEILYILDPYKKWATPKGHIEKGETAEQAAAREISEETGVDQEKIKIQEKLGDMKYSFDFKGVKICKVVTFFLVKMGCTADVAVPEDEKITDYKWVKIDEAVGFAGYDNLKEFVLKAINIIKNGNK